jgi:hypothetical protein
MAMKKHAYVDGINVRLFVEDLEYLILTMSPRQAYLLMMLVSQLRRQII